MTSDSGIVELQLRDYLDIFKRRKIALAIILALVLIASIVNAALETPMYRSAALVRVRVVSSGGLLEESQNVSSNVRTRNLQNEVKFAESDRVQSRAGSALDGQELAVTVRPEDDSDTLEFTAVHPDPDLAAEMANAYTSAYVAERSEASVERFVNATRAIEDRLAEISVERLELQRLALTSNDPDSVEIQLSSLASEETRLRSRLNEIDVVGQIDQEASVDILNLATVPNSPFAPSWGRAIALALVAGTVLGFGVALVLESLDDTIANKRDFEQALGGISVIGSIPKPEIPSRKRGTNLVTSRTGPFTEGFRSLRSAVELGLAIDTDVHSILVTSPNPSEGKSTVAAHMAMAFARNGNSVLVVDADLHNPTQHKLFSLPNRDGLAEHLAGLSTAEALTEQASGEGLVSVIPAGICASSPAELTSSAAAQDFIKSLSQAYDLVIVDSPPVRPVADTLSLARYVDACLLVSMRGLTKASDIDEALEMLARTQTRPLGAVLNNAVVSNSTYGYSYG